VGYKQPVDNITKWAGCKFYLNYVGYKHLKLSDLEGYVGKFYLNYVGYKLESEWNFRILEHDFI